MLQSIPDPFDSYGSHNTEDRLFSVLQPLSLLSENSPSSTSLNSQTTSHIHPAWVPTEVQGGDGELAGANSNSSSEALNHDVLKGDVTGSKSCLADTMHNETPMTKLVDQGTCPAL
jgi:hypothetical protein